MRSSCGIKVTPLLNSSINTSHRPANSNHRKPKNLLRKKLFILFCAAVEKRKVRVVLRTIHIEALCHAAIRWDKKRQLTGNDLHDFHHAGAALAYCNVFLTEKPLQALLHQKHLGLTQDFPCKIISAIPEATEF